MHVAHAFNPAAVIGADVLDVSLFDKEFHLRMSRQGVNTNRMRGSVSLPLALGATIPALANIKPLALGKDSLPLYSLNKSIPYAEFLDIVTRLYAAGIHIPHALLVEKAKAVLAQQVPAEYLQAYDAFVFLTKNALADVNRLSLKAFQANPRVCEVYKPNRCMALLSASGEVFMTPDLYQPNYVQVVLSRVSPDETLAIRDVLYNFFEKRAMRVEIKPIC